LAARNQPSTKPPPLLRKGEFDHGRDDASIGPGVEDKDVGISFELSEVEFHIRTDHGGGEAKDALRFWIAGPRGGPEFDDTGGAPQGI
jgi:hypothetical protein